MNKLLQALCAASLMTNLYGMNNKDLISLENSSGKCVFSICSIVMDKISSTTANIIIPFSFNCNTYIFNIQLSERDKNLLKKPFDANNYRNKQDLGYVTVGNIILKIENILILQP